MSFLRFIRIISTFTSFFFIIKPCRGSEERLNKLKEKDFSENNKDFIGDILEIRRCSNKIMISCDDDIIEEMFELIEKTTSKNIFEVIQNMDHIPQENYIKTQLLTNTKNSFLSSDDSSISEIINKLVLFDKIYFTFSQNRRYLSLNIGNTKIKMFSKFENKTTESIDNIFAIFRHLVKHKELFLKFINEKNVKNTLKKIIIHFHSFFYMMEESSNIFHWLIDYAESIQFKEEISIKYPFNQYNSKPIQNNTEISVAIREYFNFLNNYHFSSKVNNILDSIRICYTNISTLNSMFLEYSDDKTTFGYSIEKQTENLMSEILESFDFENIDNLLAVICGIKHDFLVPFSLYVDNFAQNLEFLQKSFQNEKPLSSLLTKDSIFYKSSLSEIFVNFDEPFISFNRSKERLYASIENIENIEGNSLKDFFFDFFVDIAGKIITIRTILYFFQHSTLNFIYDLCNLIESKKPDDFIMFYTKKHALDKVYSENSISNINNTILLAEKFRGNFLFSVNYGIFHQYQEISCLKSLSEFSFTQNGILSAIEFNIDEYVKIFLFSEWSGLEDTYIHETAIELIKKYLQNALIYIKKIKNSEKIKDILEYNNSIKSSIYDNESRTKESINFLCFCFN